MADQCLHEACTCTAVEGDYCSDYCREHAGAEEIAYGCGHVDCIGTGEAADHVPSA